MITHCYLSIFCCLLIKDILTEEANEPQAVATLVPLEESSEEQRVEELSSENNLDANKENWKEIRGAGMPERSSKSKAVLMSDEELAETLQKEAKEEQEVEERDLEEEEAVKEEGKERPAEMSEDDEETLSDKLDIEDAENEANEDEEEGEKDGEMLDKEEIDVEMMPFEGNLGKHAQERAWTEERRVLFEKSDGSSESEIPADLDYAADSGLLQALQTPTPPKQPDASLLLEPDGKEQQSSQEEPPTASDDGEAVDGRQASRHDEERLLASKDAGAHEQDHKMNGISPDLEENSELFMSKTGGKEEQKSGHHSLRKTKKQKKNHRERKHFPQSEQPQPGQEASRQESESSSAEDIGSKAKRRRPGKRVLEPSAV